MDDCFYCKKNISYVEMKLLPVQLLLIAPCLLHVVPCDDRVSVFFVAAQKVLDTMMKSSQAFSSAQRKDLTTSVFSLRISSPAFDHSVAFFRTLSSLVIFSNCGDLNCTAAGHTMSRMG